MVELNQKTVQGHAQDRSLFLKVEDSVGDCVPDEEVISLCVEPTGDL